MSALDLVRDPVSPHLLSGRLLLPNPATPAVPGLLLGAGAPAPAASFGCDDPASAHHGSKRPHSSSIESLDVARSRLRQTLSAKASHTHTHDVSSLLSAVSIKCGSTADAPLAMKSRSAAPLQNGHGAQVPPLSSESPFFKQLPQDQRGPEPFHPDQARVLGLDIRLVTLTQLASVYAWYFSTGLPDTNTMFPWLHGLHRKNRAQQKYFKRECLTYTKPHQARFLMAVNADAASDNAFAGLSGPGSGQPGPGPGPSLKNTVPLTDLLEPIHVSRAEVHQQIEAAFLTAFPRTHIDLASIDTLALDATAVNCLPRFRDLDPNRGVSLRNFHIQVAKCAKCADFVVYAHSAESPNLGATLRVLWLAQRVEAALEPDLHTRYGVFSVLLPISDALHMPPPVSAQLIWVDDYAAQERAELSRMSAASKLDHNVWVGNTLDYQRTRSYHTKHHNILPPKSTLSHVDLQGMSCTAPPAHWRLFVHCKGGARFPTTGKLEALLDEYCLRGRSLDEAGTDLVVLDFPASGSVGMGDCRPENLLAIVNTCKLIYLHLCASGSSDKVVATLVYCTDGYTEVSLLVLCYLMYVGDRSLEACMLALHKEHGRPYFVFESDVVVLEKLEYLLRKFSPARAGHAIAWNQLETASGAELSDMLLAPGTSHAPAPHLRLGYIEQDDDDDTRPAVVEAETNWVKETGGSLPLRILPHIYLGLIKHANSVSLLGKLGITKIISVGEKLNWLRTMDKSNVSVSEEGDIEVVRIAKCPVDTVMRVQNLRDDGIDELFKSLPRVLAYIDEALAQSDGQVRILVHCWVGVSRLATVAIAEVMRRLHVALPEAYLYVRARRLNIIIQPNLRFMYELMKWDEQERKKDIGAGEGDGTASTWIGEDAVTMADGELDSNHLCRSMQKPIRSMDWFMFCREITLLNKPYNA